MIENSIHSLLEQINDTGAEYPNDRSLAELIVEQCAKTPNNVAAVCNDQSLTFAELDRRSNQFAWFLKSHGVKPNDLVGLCSERNTGTVVSLLAILKTGAGYVPLDPDYPRDRLKFMCEDAQIQTIVTNESLVGLASELAEDVFPIESFEGEINSCDESLCLEEVSVEDSCAYVIYTSGSTGKPKGVKVQHRAVANLLHSVKTLPGIAGDDVVLAMTTLSFDISVLEIFLPLISGAKIAIIDRTTARDGVLLRDAIDQHNVSILQGTPTTWRFVIEAEWKGNPKCKIITGGSRFPVI
jgi:non-ribosomal peptide synthetase component F